MKGACLLAAVLLAGQASGADREGRMKGKLPFLKASGLGFVDAAGRDVVLRGVNLGGWMVYERWLFNVWDDAWPRDEMSLWKLLTERFGPRRARKLKEAYRRNFITDEDFALIAKMGFNCVRTPFWYGDIEAKPGRLSAAGLKGLDRAIAAAAKRGLYTILDMHGAPGGQSLEHHTGWEGRNSLWHDREAQERTVKLWEALARRYRKHPEVAAYDLLNEPMGASSLKEIMEFSGRLYRAVRKQDPGHIVIIEDGYKGHEGMPDPKSMNWENVAYSVHYYPFGRRTKEEQEKFMEMFGQIREDQLRLGVPLFVGEFSAVEESCGGLGIYGKFLQKHEEFGWSWCLWTWKRFVERPSGCIWGILNQPKSGEWRSFSPSADSYSDIMSGMESLHTRNWRAGGGMEKMLRARLSAPAAR